jgi:hypothetical protein
MSIPSVVLVHRYGSKPSRGHGRHQTILTMQSVGCMGSVFGPKHVVEATHFGVLERDEKAIQTIFLGIYYPYAFHPCDGPMESMFAQKVKALDGRRIDCTVLASRLRMREAISTCSLRVSLSQL